MAEKILYSDIRQKETYNQPILYNIKAIHQSIMNIIITNPGERLFLPEFGVGLKRYLFSFPNDNTEQDLMDRITNQIFRYEPRVKLLLNQSSVTFVDEERAYYVNLVFNIPALSVTGYGMTVVAPLEL